MPTRMRHYRPPHPHLGLGAGPFDQVAPDYFLVGCKHGLLDVDPPVVGYWVWEITSAQPDPRYVIGMVQTGTTAIVQIEQL